jgi:hypothetical protein
LSVMVSPRLPTAPLRVSPHIARPLLHSDKPHYLSVY